MKIKIYQRNNFFFGIPILKEKVVVHLGQEAPLELLQVGTRGGVRPPHPVVVATESKFS